MNNQDLITETECDIRRLVWTNTLTWITCAVCSLAILAWAPGTVVPLLLIAALLFTSISISIEVDEEIKLNNMFIKRLREMERDGY